MPSNGTVLIGVVLVGAAFVALAFLATKKGTEKTPALPVPDTRSALALTARQSPYTMRYYEPPVEPWQTGGLTITPYSQGALAITNTGA